MLVLYFLLLITDFTLTQQRESTAKIDNYVHTSTTPTLITNLATIKYSIENKPTKATKISKNKKHKKKKQLLESTILETSTILATSEEYTTTSEPTTTTEIITISEAHCDPPNITISDVSSTEISFNWTETASASKYSVEISNLGPKYDFPIESNCIADDTTETNQSVLTNSYSFNNAKPYYNYEIEVTAICSENKKSEAATINITTNPSKPDPPTNFSVKTSKEEYTFRWDAPCNLNGESLLNFTIEFNGNYTENDDLKDFTTELVEISGNFSYTHSITDKIKPSYNYKVILKVYGEGSEEPSSTEIDLTTLPGLPRAPILTEVSALETEEIIIKWAEPEEKRGKIVNYAITIRGNDTKYEHKSCRGHENNVTLKFVNGSTTNYEFKETLPYSKYTVTVIASTKAGQGNSSNEIWAITVAGKSSEVQNVKYKENYIESDSYESKAVITFDSPCDSKGPLQGYIIDYKGNRSGYPDVDVSGKKIAVTNEFIFDLKADYDYKFSIRTNTVQQSDASEITFHSSPGFPQVKSNVTIDAPEVNETSQAYFNLSKDWFDETNGIVKYYAIVLMRETTNMSLKKDDYNESSWPVIEGHECDEYQITPNFWNPFRDGSTAQVTWVIGGKNDGQNYNGSKCVKQLDAGTTYKVYVRVLTSRTWINTETSTFTTRQLEGSNVGLAVGLTIGILAIVGVGGYVVYFIKFKKRQIEETKARESNLTPQPITCKKLMDNYDIMQQYEKLKNQFVSIALKSKELNLETTSSVLTENKRKNRYINILPFDETRVKLKIEEDDDLGSDYINASYIKGYSGKVEYIATQGPLQQTCKDFWKMVVQENVTIIAMVSQFIEQNKEKCFQYFPNNGQTESYADNLHVRCVSELHFGTFCVRTLQVTKDNADYNVTHMQFLEWPDFGVPDGTNCMLEYCCQIRERAKCEGGLIVVHCSAGVGRTGTLIATDILLQTIQDHRDINVFKTVLELRKQRMNMVQTEKQYIFIHSCLKDALEDPVSPILVNIDEPLYQNVEDMGYFPKADIQPSEMTEVVEQESAF